MEYPEIQQQKLGFKLEVEANSNQNNKFTVIFSAETESYLSIKAVEKEVLFENSFSNKFTTEKIKENKYFSFFGDLKEICDELSLRIKNKDMKLIDKKDIAIISIPLPIAKFKEITFELNKDLKSDKEQINDFCKLIYELKTEINELKNEDNKKQIEINELKNEDKKREKEINELKIEMAELKEQMKKLLNEKKIKEDKKFISNLNSLIINENIEYNRLLKFWINPNIIINAELLYRLSRDGDQTSKFHELCDNQGPTLTLFEIDDGQKGGFYTPLSWNNYSNWQNDMETFSFNLNNKENIKK